MMNNFYPLKTRLMVLMAINHGFLVGFIIFFPKNLGLIAINDHERRDLKPLCLTQGPTGIKKPAKLGRTQPATLWSFNLNIFYVYIYVFVLSL